MANCKQCGTDLNGARFCPSCGASASADLVAHQDCAGVSASTDPRQRTLADMQHMVQYFGARKEQYDLFDTTLAEFEERSGRTYIGWIIAAAVILLYGLIFNLNAIYIYVIPIAICLVPYILLKKKNAEKLKVVAAQLNELKTNLEAYYTDYGYCPIGFEYTKPSTLNALYDLVRKGRASTPGDAINLYLADLEQAEMHRLQQEATDAAKETAKNSKKAARYASANFWFK